MSGRERVPVVAVGRYELSSTLGVGGFATVHRAHDGALDADVALKILQPQFASNNDITRRFLQEARLLRRVDSPNVVRVYDIGELDDGRPYFVMELADGGSLGERVRRDRGANAESVGQIVDALASGLGALHGVGIVHRDIKPDNLLIARAGTPLDTQITGSVLADNERLVIGDLGLAKDRSRTAAGPTVSGGTPLYRAPEQTTPGAEITNAADIYAATGVLWFLLTGAHPPETDAVPVELPSLPAAWQSILERGLDRDPSLRHGSIAQWAAEARQALADTLPTAAGGPIATRRRTPATTGAEPAVTATDPIGLCPYKGMAAFQPEDAGLFFGRDDLIDTLVARLQDHAVLVVGGPSGSGKSSLVRAGLIPRITRGALAGSRQWRIALFNPGSDAVGELVHQLRRLRSEDSSPTSSAELSRDELPQGGRRWLDDGVPTLLAIDQFEELFTLNRSRADQELFLDTLAVMTESEHSRIRVVVALRADFYGVCAGHPWLSDRINESQLLVGPMNKAELRDAITTPAQRAGLHLEKGLVDTILDDVGDANGALPLLGHALMETWIRRRGSQLTVDGYAGAGGVSGAIAQRADDVFTQLTLADQRTARHLLLQLINPGEGTADTRRRVQRSELRDDDELRSVMEKLAGARLLTIGDDAIEVAHEALLHSWPRLRRWIDEDRDILQTRRRIDTAAAEWDRHDRDPDLLYRGTQLAGALEWLESNPDGLSPDGVAFLDAARQVRDDGQRREAEAEARGRRSRRLAVSALAVLTVAAVTSSIFAFVALGRSQANEQAAITQLVQTLATASSGLADEQPLTATALAMESIARGNPSSATARDALVKSRLGLDEGRELPQPSGMPVPVGDMLTVAITSDAERFITGGRGGDVVFWDRATKTELQRFDEVHDHGVVALDVSDDGRWLISAGGRRAMLWDLQADAPSPEVLHEVEADDEPIWDADFSPDGDLVALGTESAGVLVVDRATGDVVGSTGGQGMFDTLSVEFIDRDVLAVSNGVGELRLLGVDGEPLGAPTIAGDDANDVWELLVDRTEDVLYSVSTDNTVKAWSTEGGELRLTASLEAGKVRIPRGLIPTKSGRELLVGDGNGRLHRIDPDTMAEIGDPDDTVQAHGDRVISASTDGSDWSVTLGDDQLVRVWRHVSGLAPVNRELILTDPTNDLAVDSDGEVVAAATDSGVQLLDAASGESIGRLGSGVVQSVRFLDEGTLLVGTDDGLVQLWSTGGSKLVEASAHDGEPVRTLAIAADGLGFVSGADDGSLVRWSLGDDGTTPTPTELDGHRAAVTGVAFLPGDEGDGDLVSIGFDRRLRRWEGDGDQTAPITDIVLEQDGPQALAVHPDGELVAIGGGAERIDVIGLDGTVLTSMAGHPGGVWDAAFTLDGLSLVSTSRQTSEVRLWDWATATPLGSAFASHDERSEPDVAVGPSGVVWSSGLDGRIRRLDVLDQSIACLVAKDVFDPALRARFLAGADTVACGS